MFEVDAEVLDLLRRGCHHNTELMYKANLAWPALQRSLTRLEVLGFVEGSMCENHGQGTHHWDVTATGQMRSLEAITALEAFGRRPKRVLLALPS
jgi:predicted transcriptional regulator